MTHKNSAPADQTAAGASSERKGGGLMTPEEILQCCLDRLEGTVPVESWGERGVFYNPGLVRKRGVYVLTVKEKDGANDRASQLDRPGVYRVNFGLRRERFRALFGPQPKRPPKGGVVDTGHDFTALDRLLPHPVYGWMSWVCVLNPSEETFRELWPLMEESWEYAKEKFYAH